MAEVIMRVLPFLAFAICGPLAGSELVPTDFRINLLLVPATEKVEATYRFPNGSGSRVESERLDPGYRVEVGLVTRFTQLSRVASIVGGGWVFYGEQESRAKNGGDLGIMSGPRSYLVFGVDLHVALRTEFNQYFSMEVGPVVGVGTTHFSDRVATGMTTTEERTGHGEYQEAAMNLQFLVRNVSRSAMVGLGVRYLLAHGDASNQFSSFTQDVEVQQYGFTPYLTLGMTF